MSLQVQITLRTRKLGVLIRDARISVRKTGTEVARAIGITPALLRAYEEGRQAPSLPELEVLAYYLNLPVQHFWGGESLSDDSSRNEPINTVQLVMLRQRIIGALLRQKRLQASISVKGLAVETGISPRRLNAYELGESALPVPELEAILAVIGGQVENFFDQNGPIGKWMSDQAATQEFLKLSPELRSFICAPVNHPYLELARNLSQLSTERLRAVGEALLDITF
jgi:transcriptional regulator with XRE-family HTH domain